MRRVPTSLVAEVSIQMTNVMQASLRPFWLRVLGSTTHKILGLEKEASTWEKSRIKLPVRYAKRAVMDADHEDQNKIRTIRHFCRRRDMP